MFYFIIAVAVLGYLIYQGLQRIERKSLTISCPCVLVLSIINFIFPISKRPYIYRSRSFNVWFLYFRAPSGSYPESIDQNTEYQYGVNQSAVVIPPVTS